MASKSGNNQSEKDAGIIITLSIVDENENGLFATKLKMQSKKNKSIFIILQKF